MPETTTTTIAPDGTKTIVTAPQPIKLNVAGVGALVQGALGVARTLGEFLASFTSKVLGLACFMMGLLVFVGLATMESDSVFALWCFGLATFCFALVVWYELAKKLASLRVTQEAVNTYEKRAVDPALQAALLTHTQSATEQAKG